MPHRDYGITNSSKAFPAVLGFSTLLTTEVVKPIADAAGISAADLLVADRVVLTASAAASIHYRYDGGDPGLLSGHVINATGENSNVIIRGNVNINNLRFRRSAAVSSTCSITLEKV